MWGWFYEHAGKIAAVAGAVVGAAVVVMVPALAVGKVVVAAVSLGASAVSGLVAYGLKSLYEAGVKAGEVKGAAMAPPPQEVVQAHDDAFAAQNDDKANADQQMEALLAKAIADQAQLKTEKKKAVDQLAAKEAVLAKAIEDQAQLKTEKKKAVDQLTVKEAELATVIEDQTKLKTDNAQVLQQLATKTNELAVKTTECEEIAKKFSEVFESHKKTKTILVELTALVEKDGLDIENLKQENERLRLKAQQTPEKVATPPKSANKMSFIATPKKNDAVDFAEEDNDESPRQVSSASK